MKNLIYQYWIGPDMPLGATAGRENIEAYADRIGVTHRFQRDAPWMSQMCEHARTFERFRPIFDPTFDEYDGVAVLDLDIFSVEGLTENIFDHMRGGMMLCEEPHQPAYRENRVWHISGTHDQRWASEVKERWGITVPRDRKGRPLVYNAGLILMTRAARQQARVSFLPPQQYIEHMRNRKFPRFYTVDQNYIHAMACAGHVDFQPLSSEWNRQIHYVDSGIYDGRTKDTRMVHVQLRHADDRDAAWHHRIVNKPQREWILP